MMEASLVYVEGFTYMSPVLAQIYESFCYQVQVSSSLSWNLQGR
jgi:hypothetical protein